MKTPFWIAVALFCGVAVASCPAQPYVVSSTPAIGGTVTPCGPVVLTFNEPMDTAVTTAMFYSFTLPNPGVYSVNITWSADQRTMTCTPNPPFPANKSGITWQAQGTSEAGEALDDTDVGSFSTDSSPCGGSGSGTGTNAITAFSVGTLHYYRQTSGAAPIIDGMIPFNFIGETVLASNRTASSITVTPPTSAPAGLNSNLQHPERWMYFSTYPDLASLTNAFPSGNYVFNVQSAASNQQVTVNLPASLLQPPAPRVTNFAAAQAVVASAPFTLAWDAFAGGTASDYIRVQIGDAFETPLPGASGALNGTATSVVIPANTLPAGSNACTVSFHRQVANSYGSYSTIAFRSTGTELPIVTGSSPTTLILTNFARVGGVFRFDLKSAPGQTVTVLYRTNLSTGSWLSLLTTNNPTGTATITDPASATNKVTFYRARTGN